MSYEDPRAAYLDLLQNPVDGIPPAKFLDDPRPMYELLCGVCGDDCGLEECFACLTSREPWPDRVERLMAARA